MKMKMVEKGFEMVVFNEEQLLLFLKEDEREQLGHNGAILIVGNFKPKELKENEAGKFMVTIHEDNCLYLDIPEGESHLVDLRTVKTIEDVFTTAMELYLTLYSKEEVLKKMYVDTPVGQILIEEKSDKFYPGVYISLINKNEVDEILACIEYEPFKGKIQTSCFADPKLSDDATHQVVYEGIYDTVPEDKERVVRLNEGDMVEAIVNRGSGVKKGEKGTILEILDKDNIAVVFETFNPNRHDLGVNGTKTCEYGYGYYCIPGQLTKINK